MHEPVRNSLHADNPAHDFPYIIATDTPGEKKWSIGLKFTGIKRSGYPKSDGTPVDPLFHGYPWFEELPAEFSSYRTEPINWLDAELVAFRNASPSLVFFGVGSYPADTGGRVRPALVAFDPREAFPDPRDTAFHDMEELRLESQEIEVLAKAGKINAISQGRVIPACYDEATLSSVNYRCFGGDSVRRIHSGINTNHFIFPGTSTKLPGVSIKNVGLCLPNSFTSESFTVVNPSVAKAYDRVFEFVAPETVFSPRIGGLYYSFSIPIEHLPPEAIFTLSKDGFVVENFRKVIFARHLLTPLLSLKSLPPLKVSYSGRRGSFNEEVILTNDQSKIVPYRNICHDYSDIPKYPAYLIGREAPLGGLYCLPEDVAKAPKLNKSSLKELRSKYSWAQKEHLGESEANLSAHDHYLSLLSYSVGWLLRYSPNGFFDKLFHSIAIAHFTDDDEVFARSPLAQSDTYYKKPTMEKIKSNPDAYYAFLSSVRKDEPVAFSLLSNPKALDVLMAGDISQ